eukprot:5689649-Prymnesium_polylepis.1
MRDTPPLGASPLRRVIFGDGSEAEPEALRQLCGLVSLAGVREPFSAVRLLADANGAAAVRARAGPSRARGAIGA